MKQQLDIQWIPVSELQIDSDYQRALNPGVIAKMRARGWDWKLCGTLKVADRKSNGRYVFDGQHRLFLAVENGVKALPCVIIESLGAAEEAALFAASNTALSKPGAYDYLRSMIAAKDAGACRINAVMEKHGFRLANTKSTNTVPAAAALTKTYDRFGVNVLDQTFRVLRTAWNGSSDSTSNEFISGIANFIAVYEADERTISRLIDVLSKQSPRGVQRRFPSEVDSPAMKCTHALITLHDQNLRTGRLGYEKCHRGASLVASKRIKDGTSRFSPGAW